MQEVDDASIAAAGRLPTGIVVGIVQRTWRTRGYAGSLKEPQGGVIPPSGRTASLLFVPLEHKVPFIRIQTQRAPDLMDKRIVVVIDEWPVDSQNPIGHYVQSLGKIGDREAETAVLFLEHDINTAPFTAAVHACVPPLPWTVTDEDRAAAYRADLRGVCVCRRVAHLRPSLARAASPGLNSCPACMHGPLSQSRSGVYLLIATDVGTCSRRQSPGFVSGAIWHASLCIARRCLNLRV